MKTFFAFIRKEFYHVLRDPKTLAMLIGIPIIQITIYGFALTNEVKNIPLLICNYAQDEAAFQLIEKINSNPYFTVANVLNQQPNLEKELRHNQIEAALIIPNRFEQDLRQSNKANLEIITDSSDPNYANTVINYLTSIVQFYQNDINNTGQGSTPYQINVQVSMLYNPALEGAPNFVPGVMALVLLLVCVMMTSVSVVKEKESGTMEVLLVSPFSPLLVIVSKTIPYFLVSVVNLLLIIFMSTYMLDLPVKGSILLLMLESFLLIFTALSLGMLISTICDTQQTAMLISLMGMLLPTMLFSGFMFPIENMPVPMQWVSNIIPSKWYYIIVKDIMIKGVGFDKIWKETLILMCMNLFFVTVSISKFRNRLQ